MRFHSIEKEIDEIEEDDRRVSLVGTVVRKNTTKYSLVLDDGTGEIKIYAENLPEIGSLIRVIGKTFQNSDLELCINAEIIQDFSGFDVSLYKRARAMEASI